MFKAEAVWKTDKKGEFSPANFEIEVDLTVNYELGMDTTEKLFEYVRNNKCDGFVIDYGTGKRYLIKG